MRLELEEMETYTMDQTGSIEEMPHLHRLAEASGAKAPKSEESNGHKAHYSPVDNTRREE